MNKQQGGISILVILLTIIILGGGGYFLLSNNKDIASTSSIPEECESSQDDACSLFSCMTPSCWCEDSPLGGVVYQEEAMVRDEKDAKRIVANYLDSMKLEDNQVVKAVRLNAVFFNVFIEDSQGYEEVFVVSDKGEVLVTVCGV